jgi:hypothetical protein
VSTGTIVDQAADAASSIKALTSSGIDASEAWLAFSLMTFLAPRRPDIHSWFAGAIIRSSLEIWYHEGFLFQAGAVSGFSKVLATGAFWVTAMTRASLAVRSWQKLAWNLSDLTQRYPSLSGARLGLPPAGFSR